MIIKVNFLDLQRIARNQFCRGDDYAQNLFENTNKKNKVPVYFVKLNEGAQGVPCNVIL